MKQLLIGMFIIVAIASCTPGETENVLTGSEQQLPPQLKGLEVYRVQTRYGEKVQVAILNGAVNSTTYQHGKTHSTCVHVVLNDERIIHGQSILFENDSVVMIRKK